TAGFAQNLVSFNQNGTMTVVQTNQMITKAFGNAVPPTSKALDLYKINYRSRDEKNRNVVLTGLIAFPKGGAPKGLVVFNHGTIADRQKSPSRFTGKDNGSEAQVAVLAFASGGYAVVMPDYLGLGDHTGPHPYPLANANSPSAVDIIAPARQIARRLNINVGAQLYVSGYSEGGAVGMWMLRDLEKKSGADYTVTSAALGSGPYDLSGVTRKWILQSPSSQEEFVVKLYLTGYMVDYFHKSAGVKIVDYFKPSMAFTIDQAFKGKLSDEAIIKRLALAAVLMRAKNSFDNVITPKFKKALETLDTKDPLIREMIKSDCYDWSPRTKMLLINLVNDKVVIPENTAKAIETMRRRGIGANLLRQYVVNDANLNHVTGMPAVMAQARRFFDEGFPN
ncbi:MAG TPA: alpha/beta hydrolase, partial [Pyrinomonadaceae bacterium]|nr:alpha/beta hydrolase [Pyrinomonadaceae bacterium]